MRAFLCLLLLSALPLVLAKGTVSVSGGGSSFATSGTQPQLNQWKTTTAWTDNYEGTFTFAKYDDYTQRFIDGTVDFLGRDSGLNATEIKAISAARDNTMVFHLPQYLSANAIVYNLPGYTGPSVNLTVALLAKIYSGVVVRLNDTDLIAVNPALASSALDLTQPIVPVARGDSSTATYEFTLFLNQFVPTSTGVNPNVWPAPAWGVTWASNVLTAPGGSELVNLVKDTPYSFGITKKASADKMNYATLQYASIQNRFGNFIFPDATKVTLTASSYPSLPLAATTTSAWLELNLGAGATDVQSYPAVFFGYLMVPQINQVVPGTYKAGNLTALTDFLTAATASTTLASKLPAGYVAPPQSVLDANKVIITNWLTPGGPGTPGINAAHSTAAVSVFIIAALAVAVNAINKAMM